MADAYIDQFETQVYGKFAREQMAGVCLGRIEALDGMITYAISAQEKADATMKEALDQRPEPPTEVDGEAVLGEARDTLVRFGNYLESLRGYPLPLSTFFGADSPSVAARRRLTKLVGRVGVIVDEIVKAGDVIRDPTWLTEFQALDEQLRALQNQRRSAAVDQALAPEVAAAREAWLAVYGANKHLIRGFLGHFGKPELLPLIFDDLAEVHQAKGVSDGPAPAGAAEGDASQPE